MTRLLGKSGTTDLQAERLAWIVQALTLTGFPPTVAELARHFYITVSSANDTVRALRYNGLLTRKTLSPTRRGYEHWSLSSDRCPLVPDRFATSSHRPVLETRAGHLSDRSSLNAGGRGT